MTDGYIDALFHATRTDLEAAYNRLKFHYATLEQEQAQIAAHDSHAEYDPVWIADGEMMSALWLGMGAIHSLILQQDAEWTPPPWEEGDPEPF